MRPSASGLDKHHIKLGRLVGRQGSISEFIFLSCNPRPKKKVKVMPCLLLEMWLQIAEKN